jgi:hypothetical protein
MTFLLFPFPNSKMIEKFERKEIGKGFPNFSVA